MKKQAGTTHFFYQNGKLTTVSENGRPRTIFRADDRPLAEQHAGDAGNAGLLATDDKGSVLTVQSNDEEEDHTFSVYGHDPNIHSGRTLIGFNGERIESAFNYYLLGNGYRTYTPLLRRFQSPDNLSPFMEGGFNAYGYCSGDPVNLTDPTGHMQNNPPPQLPRYARLGPVAKRVMSKKILGTSSPGMEDMLLLKPPGENFPPKPITAQSSSSRTPGKSTPISTMGTSSIKTTTPRQNDNLNVANPQPRLIPAEDINFLINQIESGAKRMKRSLSSTEKNTIEKLKTQQSRTHAREFANQNTEPAQKNRSTRSGASEAMLY